MPKPLLVDRWALARAFNVSPSTIVSWLREGLSASRARPGAPQTPALFDGAKAAQWFNATKAAGQRAWARPVTLDDIRAAADTTNGTKSEALRAAERLFDDELARLAAPPHRRPPSKKKDARS